MTGSVPAAHQPSASSVPQAQRTNGGHAETAGAVRLGSRLRLSSECTPASSFHRDYRVCAVDPAVPRGVRKNSLFSAALAITILLPALRLFFFSQYTSVPLGVVDPSVIRIASAAGHVTCDGSYQPGIAPSFRFRLFTQVFVV